MGSRRRTLAVIAGLAALPGVALAMLTWWLLRRAHPDAFGTALAVRDYLNLWAGGALAWSGEVSVVFDPPRYAARLRQMFGAALPLHTWSYPPPLLFLAVPLGALPIVPGFLLWASGSLAALLTVLRRSGAGWWTCLAVLASPAALDNWLAGQNGALTAAALEGGLLLVDRRPLLAGMLFGLLTMKPQLGLLVPVCLVAAGRWRTIVAAGATALCLVAGSAAAWGGDAWWHYLGDVRPFMIAQVLEQPQGAGFQRIMATPFILVRSLGGSLPLAYGLQTTITAGCAGLAWQAWRKPGADPAARTALIAALSLLATPYGFSYDMVGVAVGVALLAGIAAEAQPLPCEAPLLVAAWAWPGLAFWLGGSGLPPLGCLVLAGAAFCAWRRLRPIPLLGQHHLGVPGAATGADRA